MEKVFHSANIRCISTQEEFTQVDSALRELISLDFVKEKLVLSADPFLTAQDTKQYVFTFQVNKERLVRQFTRQLFLKFDRKTLEVLARQLESRIDDECRFFLRIDKYTFLERKKFVLTQGGSCIHFSFVVASYPKEKRVAVETVQKYLNTLEN